MTQRKNQEQEDLLADFDKTARAKHVKNYPGNSRKLVDDENVSSGKKVHKPRLKLNFFNQIKVHQSSMKSAKSPKKATTGTIKAAVASNVKLEKCPNRASEGASKSVAEVGNAISEENFDWLENEEFLNDFTPDYFTDLEDVKMNFISKIEGFLNSDYVIAVVKLSKIGCDLATVAVRQMFCLEEEFQYVTAITLICYGGSWTILAGVFAAGDAFGTKRVLTEACKVCMKFISEDGEDEEKILPIEIKESVKQLGLQMSLLIAIIASPSWAELCITIALASKYACLLPVKDIMKKTKSDSLEDVFDNDTVEDSWFNLLALIACNILSLTVFGCFPRFTTSVYMGYVGLELMMKGLMNNVDMPVDKELWKNNQTQYYAWAVVTVMAMWQAFYGYTGIVECLSWVMFVYPVVKLYNYVNNMDFEGAKITKLE